MSGYKVCIHRSQMGTAVARWLVENKIKGTGMYAACNQKTVIVSFSFYSSAPSIQVKTKAKKLGCNLKHVSCSLPPATLWCKSSPRTHRSAYSMFNLCSINIMLQFMEDSPYAFG